VGDPDTPAAGLVVTAASSNQALVPDANLAPGGSASARQLTITPAPNQNSAGRGTAVITVTVSDGIRTASDTFVLTVTAVNDSPSAQAKSYTAQANMKISVPAGSGLLAGAADPNDVAGNPGWTPVFTVGGATATTSPAGGTVTIDAATGAFDFDPPPGVTGTVTFTYTVCDNGQGTPASRCSAAATVTFTVSGPVIWFVDDSAASGGTGRLSAPFTTLAAAGTAVGTSTGHRIFLYSGTYSTGRALNAGEWLIGQGVSPPSPGDDFDDLFGIAPPAGTMARPVIGGTRPVVRGQVAMATGGAARGLNVQPASGTQGLTASGVTGLTVGEVSVSTTSAVAVNLSASSGAFALTSVSANGGASGIVLNAVNTGAGSGSFTVAGTGGSCTLATPTCSGGTIQNTTGVGISLTSTRDVSLSHLLIRDTGSHGIEGTAVVNFALQSSVVAGAGDADNEDGIHFATAGADNLSGAAAIRDSFVDGHQENGLYVRNDSGTLTLTVANTDFSNSVLEDGILLETFGTASLTALVEDGAFSGLESDGIKANANAGTLNITARDNTFTGDATSDNALSFVSAGGATMRYTIANNTLNASHNSAMILQANDSSVMHGRVLSNVISGTTNGNGIDGALAADDSSRARLLIDGNTVNGQRQGAMFFNANNTGQLDVTITANTMGSRPADPTTFENLTVSANGTSNVCANIRSNSVALGGSNAGGLGFSADAFRLDDDDTPTNSTLRLERGGSTSADPVQVIRDNNPTSLSNTVSISDTITLVADNTCLLPETAPLP
jgi:hypothetical protein